ncbi:MAG TPA: radical SAM protein, partial [Bacteroidetes bacterium]|nr:radical SAM protein [Bacteroidota bacterium]
MESLSLYLHIPFCERKCPYCDFYSLTGSVDLQRQFVQALITEIEIVSAKFSQNSFKVETIFFGGGTPSVLPPDEIEKIGAALQKYFHISPEAEITLEANPGTIDQEKCQRY